MDSNAIVSYGKTEVAVLTLSLEGDEVNSETVGAVSSEPKHAALWEVLKGSLGVAVALRGKPFIMEATTFNDLNYVLGQLGVRWSVNYENEPERVPMQDIPPGVIG